MSWHMHWGALPNHHDGALHQLITRWPPHPSPVASYDKLHLSALLGSKHAGAAHPLCMLQSQQCRATAQCRPALQPATHQYRKQVEHCWPRHYNTVEYAVAVKVVLCGKLLPVLRCDGVDALSKVNDGAWDESHTANTVSCRTMAQFLK